MRHSAELLELMGKLVIGSPIFGKPRLTTHCGPLFSKAGRVVTVPCPPTGWEAWATEELRRWLQTDEDAVEKLLAAMAAPSEFLGPDNRVKSAERRTQIEKWNGFLALHGIQIVPAATNARVEHIEPTYLLAEDDPDTTLTAPLSFIEKAKLEKLFEMGGGYVLDFSNRTLEEFVLQSVHKNIWDDAYNYSSGSKANRIRAFWDREPNSIVGKLIAALLEYRELRHPSRDEESQRLHEDCRRIVERLSSTRRAGESAAATVRPVLERPSASAPSSAALDTLRSDLEALSVQPDRQKAGLKLETLLNRLFSLFNLSPRRPFELVGEQIDGSFELDHDVYLLEAKWEREPLREKELLVFRGKIEGKSSFTRGVLVAMNGITQGAETAIKVGKQPTFFVIVGHDLRMVLGGALPFDDFLRRRRRLLAEEGAVTAPFDRVAR